MPYADGTRLPGEMASKLGHLAVVQSEWVKSLVNDFERIQVTGQGPLLTNWNTFDPHNIKPLRNIWATDGSFVTVKSDGNPSKEMAFVKTALLTVDYAKLSRIDKETPHPLLLQDVLRDSAVFHATVFPLKNVHTSLGNNYDAIRHIVRDSMRLDQDGAFYETLKWISFKKWNPLSTSISPAFECPHCNEPISGLPFDSDEGICSNRACNKEIFLTDMIGFHLDMDEDSAPDSIPSAYMLIMEHLMLFTAVRLLWIQSDNHLVSDTLFIKDGPLTLRGQYSKLVPNIRSLLQYAKDVDRPIHIIGQEKSGTFFDHLASIAPLVPPHAKGEPISYSALTHDYVRREVYRSPDLSNPYGKRTNWGEKVLLKIDPGTYMVINIPTGHYNDDPLFPSPENLIGIDRILATITGLVSHKFEGALFPIELANGIASMSSYPSAKVLKRFISQ
ncbi:MAG TPA: hypothetical protein VHE54_10110 [Puia sp.]|nr:hypothetical protein [Puia sp.]